MSALNPAAARAVAADVLNLADPEKDDVVNVLTGFLKQTDEPQRTTDLVFGVLKNRCLIDTVIEKISAVPAARIPPRILDILRVALYELIYCPLTAQYAVVSQAVENVKSVAGRKQTGFANAVLRQVTRHIEARERPLAGAPGRRTIPQNLLTGCQFDLDLLADAEQSPADYLTEAFSLPRGLVAGWMKAFGLEHTRRICFACNRRPSIYLRPNTLKTTVEGLVEKLRCEEIRCEVITDVNMIKLESPGEISRLPGFSDGLFTVQDISAAMAVRTMQPQPGSLILDLCSAPGTKTTQLAELTSGKAKVVATDIDNRRLEKVKDNISRLGLAASITVIEFHTLDGYVEKQGSFDCVLLDVPCSNTGVLAKRPEVRYRLTENAVTTLAGTQLDLLRRTKNLLKSGGLIAYSTCSIQPEENTLLVKRFLEGHDDFKLVTEKLMQPLAEGFDHDGAYVAVLANVA